MFNKFKKKALVPKCLLIQKCQVHSYKVAIARNPIATKAIMPKSASKNGGTTRTKTEGATKANLGQICIPLAKKVRGTAFSKIKTEGAAKANLGQICIPLAKKVWGTVFSKIKTEGAAKVNLGQVCIPSAKKSAGGGVFKSKKPKGLQTQPQTRQSFRLTSSTRALRKQKPE